MESSTGPSEAPASAVWHGSDQEYAHPIEVVGRNCACVLVGVGEVVTGREAHATPGGQGLLDGLVLERRTARRLPLEDREPAPLLAGQPAPWAWAEVLP